MPEPTRELITAETTSVATGSRGRDDVGDAEKKECVAGRAGARPGGGSSQQADEAETWARATALFASLTIVWEHVEMPLPETPLQTSRLGMEPRNMHVSQYS